MPLTQQRLALGWDLNLGGVEIFNHCLGHGKRSSFQVSDICLCVNNNCIPPKPMSPPPAPSYSSAGSSQPLIPDMPTYVGRASLWTNLNFSWEQVSLVWESNKLFSAFLFYIWLYFYPLSCMLALTHTYICIFMWGEAKFQPLCSNAHTIIVLYLISIFGTGMIKN